MLTDALPSESGRSLLHHRVTDFDAEQKLDVSIGGFRFCPQPEGRRTSNGANLKNSPDHLKGLATAV